jgi:cysteinyl-tRNA synthetase
MGHPVRLFNTLGRTLETFEPLEGDEVRMYSCGPTVYAYQHIGNLRAYVFADSLRRLLEWKGFAVRQIVNITDVGHLTSDRDEGEDKVETAAQSAGETVAAIVERYAQAFFDDLEAVRVEPPERWPRASEHIDEMIDFIRVLEQKGFAYLIPAGLFFDTSLLPDYGKLAQLDLEGLLEGARVAPTPGKRNPTDFALWRTSPPDSKRLIEWDSPWGRGTPGWHVECSTMSIKYLGRHFDVHTGGVDHIPVHHTNEIAQSEAYLGDGQPWVRYWLHNEFINLSAAKMSKSSGPVLLLRDLEEAGYHPLVYRRLLLGAHYRNQTDFTWSGLEDSRIALRRLLERLRKRLGSEPLGEPLPLAAVEGQLSPEGEAVLDAFDAALSNDLNTPEAVAVVTSASRDEGLPAEDLALLVRTFERALALGLLDVDPAALDPPAEIELGADEVDRLVAERDEARRAGDFARADEIREELQRRGVEIRDSEEGTTWRPVALPGGRERRGT